jgi:hypothetical protein
VFDHSVTTFGNKSGGGGVNADHDTGFFSDMGIPSPLNYYTYFEDFSTYVAGDWTITKVGTGTVALTPSAYGALLLTNTTGTSDSIVMQLTNASFKLAAGLRCWGSIIATVSGALTDLILGLVDETTTPYSAITDGIWLSSAATTALTANIVANSGTPQTLTSTTGPTPALVAASPFTFSWYYDGAVYSAGGTTGPQYGRVVFELSGAGVASSWRGAIACGSTFPYTTLLSPTIGMQNTTALANTLTVDRVFVAQDRKSVLSSAGF